jgi:hypothetical protein
MKFWHPHIYENKWKKFDGTITFSTSNCRIFSKDVVYKSNFEIKKCIFCEIEKFRVSHKIIHELVNSKNQEVFRYLWDGLIELKTNIFRAKKFVGKTFIVKSKTNNFLVASNRIKKLYI